MHETVTPTTPGREATSVELPAVDSARPVGRAPRDIYQRRRETLAAALLIGGAFLVWSQIGETATAVLGR